MNSLHNIYVNEESHVQVKIQNWNGGIHSFAGSKNRFYFETLLHADVMVADLQSHFKMIRIYS